MRITVIDQDLGKRLLDRSFGDFPVRIGRDAGSDVALPYGFVSRHHAEVRRDGDDLYLCVLDVKNQLSVDQRLFSAGSAVPLSRRLVVAIGTLELRLDPTLAQASPPTRPAELAPDDGLPVFDLDARDVVVAHGEIDGDAMPALPEDDAAARHAARFARLNVVAHSLRPAHAQLCTARRAWELALSQAVASVQQEDPASVVTLLREFPRGDWSGFAPAGVDAFSDEQRRGVVLQAAAELLPTMRAPSDDDEARRFLARTIDILRVFAACVLELQHVRAQQATELGVTWPDSGDPLAAMETGATVLGYLLDWREAGERRSEELVRLFAGLVDHQRAYARAALLASREAIATISPAQIERGAQASWPSRSAALWRHFEACHAAIAGTQHDELTPLFRDLLARGYRDSLARAGVPVRDTPALDPP